jgi:hypothetical protein
MVDCSDGFIALLIFVLFEMHEWAYVLLVEGEMPVQDFDHLIMVSIYLVRLYEEVRLFGG